MADTDYPWMTAQQAAEHLQLSKTTFRRLVDSGDLATYRIGKRLLRFKREDLDALLSTVHEKR